MSRARGIVAIGLLSLPVLAVAAAAVFWFFFDRPLAGDGSVEIVVKRGAVFSETAADLEREGLVKDADYLTLRFRILSKLDLVGQNQAGRYVMERGLKPSQYISALTSPSSANRVYVDLVLPPGLTSSQIALKIEESGLAAAEDVLSAIKVLAGDYPVPPRPEGLQGYLFPDTYKIEKPLDGDSSAETAEEIVRQMTETFFEVLDEVDPTWKDLTPARLHEKVTLASIVEREYRVAEEAPMIAAVFNNRIMDGTIGLQSCATVVYAIEETAEGAPFRKEYHAFDRRIFNHYLEIPSPYNTYYNHGLPPGPISNPGRTALEAAFFPADSDALFFVVKDPVAGTHVFSRSYDDHLDAREAYLKQYVVKD